MPNPTAANGKVAAYSGVPWEGSYGYAQAVKVGDTIYISGQFSHDEKGILVAPASLDGSGRPADFSMMEEQMRATYANAVKLLARFGATLDNIVEETLYVLDVDAAFGVAGKVRKEAYDTALPLCASNLIGVSRLALPEQLIEIVFKAVLPRNSARPNWSALPSSQISAPLRTGNFAEVRSRCWTTSETGLTEDQEQPEAWLRSSGQCPWPRASPA